MAYNDFTLAKLRQQFGLTTRTIEGFFGRIEELPVPPFLAATLDRQLPLATVTTSEKGKSEWIISPILVEVRVQLADQVSLFSGVDFPVDPSAGLNGRCDFVLTRNPEQLDLVAPVCMLVEAKNEEILSGIPQAIAEMIAARRFNESAGTAIATIYGVVSTGYLWIFLKLDGDVASIDTVRYSIDNPGRIYATLRAMALGEVPA